MNTNNKKRISTKKLFTLIGLTVGFGVLIFKVLATESFMGSNSIYGDYQKDWWQYLLLFMMIIFILAVSNAVLKIDRKDNGIKSQIMLYSSMFLTVVMCFVTDLYFGEYARPLALAGIFAAVTLNKRAAIYTNVALAMIFILVETFAKGFSQITVVPSLCGMFAGVIMSMLISSDDTRLKTVFTIVAMIPVYVILTVIFGAIFNTLNWDMLVSSLLQSALSPVLAGFLFLGLLPLFEAMFKLVTPYYLSELIDINKGILFKLSVEAPGTFNHSLAVANLTGACALALGEDVRLARATSYYHDVGKLSDPSVFKENLISDEQNPHDKLTPELSVNLIKRHVTYGVELLRKHGLPEEIIKGVMEHHGTLPMKFFYHKATKFTDGYVDIAEYSYEGPRPTSKVTAIIMIVDAAEAAVRTIHDRTRVKIDEVIKSIIEERMELEQFDDCDITFRDLQIIRRTLVDNFAGIYHERIEYPKLKLVRRQNDQSEEK